MAPLRPSPARAGLVLLGLAAPAALGCKASPPANPAFDDAARYLVRVFDSGTDAERAYGMRALEEQVYLNIDLEAATAANRSVEPAQIEEQDVADLERPARDLDRNMPVAVGVLSAYGPQDLARVIVLPDQVPVEPSSQGDDGQYDRTLLDGGDCWLDGGCDALRTYNLVTRSNVLYTVTYELWKDYRWVDLALPDPADVPEGEEAVNEGEPRWGILVRSWMKDSASSEGGTITIWQSFAMEIMVPRDCAGFVRDGSEENRDGGAWQTDSCGGGSVRMQAMWSETEIGVDDDVQLSATRTGMSDGMEAYDDWLDAH
ncbi:hypothetical protein L6R53_31880 [Myxococcota bacterium]|nr:hypothetical protein [Myxococcota bacterium]